MRTRRSSLSRSMRTSRSNRSAVTAGTVASSTDYFLRAPIRLMTHFVHNLQILYMRSCDILFYFIRNLTNNVALQKLISSSVGKTRQVDIIKFSTCHLLKNVPLCTSMIIGKLAYRGIRSQAARAVIRSSHLPFFSIV